MKRLLLPCLLFLLLPFLSKSQCTTTNATSCACETAGATNCTLLPDMIVARPPLTVSGSNGVIEYSQSGNGSNDGLLRISVSTPNIGHGPLEVRTTDKYICGTDTITGTAPTTCPNTGLPPKQLVVQRVYSKNGNVMNYIDRDAGTMTYHPSHGHMHVDDWGRYSLRTQTSDPNPLNWPIVGTGAKLAFCLMDYGSCSTYNGHCVDGAGNTLLNSNFPNYGLGGGAYNCSPVVQGISSGYTDIYYQSLDGMYIDVPPGTCNGDYYIVVQLDPYNYFLEENENNNILVVPYTLTQQVASNTATISSTVVGSVCTGTQVPLNANTGPGYTYLWSTGETTASINATVSGNYVVTVTTPCGTATSSPYNVSVIGGPPATTGASVCNPAAGTLTATAAGSTIKWYANSTGGSSLFTGNSFTTPVLSTTTSYYAEATKTTSAVTSYSTPNSNAFGIGGYFTGSQYMIFDAYQNFVLASVKVYAQAATSTTVELRNSMNVLLNSVTVSIPSGESRITLNWPVATGTDLRLTRSGAASLYRNNSGTAYPYTIPNYLSIKNSSAGSSFYYFFYDWEIQIPPVTCVSSRVPATVTVNNAPAQPASVIGASKICPGTSGNYSTAAITGATSYTWTVPSGATITSGQGTNAITVQFAQNYNSGNVCVLAANNCGSSQTFCKAVGKKVATQPGTISGQLTGLCTQTVNLSIAAVSGATSYNWTLPAGCTNISGQGTTAISFNLPSGFNSGQVCVNSYNGCTSSSSKCVNIYGAPSQSPITGPVSVCAGQNNVTYSVAPVYGATIYQWSLPSGTTFISGQNTNTISVHIGSNAGQISCRVKNACGSLGVSKLNFSINCRLAAEHEFNVFPNPATDKVEVQFNADNAGTVQLQLCDLMGKVVIARTIQSTEGFNNVILNVDGFSRGTYMLNIIRNDVTDRTKIVIQ
jgi:hypothetical protein